jgi:hypothetical protein
MYHQVPWSESYGKFKSFSRVRKFFATEVQYPKLLKMAFDVLRYALSNETTLKKFYHDDLTNLPFLCWYAVSHTVYGITHRVSVNRELSISWEASPSSIVSMVKNLCSNSCDCYENETLLKNSGPKILRMCYFWRL